MVLTTERFNSAGFPSNLVFSSSSSFFFLFFFHEVESSQIVSAQIIIAIAKGNKKGQNLELIFQ